MGVFIGHIDFFYVFDYTIKEFLKSVLFIIFYLSFFILKRPCSSTDRMWDCGSQDPSSILGRGTTPPKREKFKAQSSKSEIKALNFQGENRRHLD